MPYRAIWLIEGRVIFLEQWGHFTVDDFFSAISSANALIDHSSAPTVHVIVNNSHISKVDMSLRHLREAAKRRHARLGLTLVINAIHPVGASLTNFMLALFLHDAKAQIRLVNDPASALEFLRHYDTGLAPHLPATLDISLRE